MDEICVKRRIAAEFVKPFSLGGKNDAAGAEAIARSADGSDANRWRGRYFL
jgi:hypothetical protein